MVRAGLVGYGFAGRDIHAPLMREAGIEIAAVQTANPQRREHAAADHPGTRIVDDLASLLGVEGLDLVVLASPSGVHGEQALRVVEGGLPLVVDKPLAVDAAEAQRVVEAADLARVPLTVFQNRRFDAEHVTMVEVARSGEIGEVYRAELRWERWRPVPKERWREQAPASEGGGIMLDLQSHLVDGAVDLLGEVGSVFAEVATRTTVAEDDVFLACQHVSGATSHLITSSVAAAPGPRLRVLGSRGAFLLSAFDHEPNIFPDLVDADPGPAGWISRGDERVPARRAASSQADFYRAVAGALGAADPQRAMPVDPRDAVHTLAVIDAARVSGAEGRVVDVVTPGQGSGPREAQPRGGH
jgi:predicted dehydrogenase